MDMLTKRNLLRSAVLTIHSQPIRKPFPVQAQSRADRPGFFKAKDMAEIGSICGLPMVTNYGFYRVNAARVRQSPSPISESLL